MSEAKDAYFAAQSHYDSGQYDDALAKLDEAKRLRGATDAYFLALRVRIQLALENYGKASVALDAFDNVQPSHEHIVSLRDARVKIHQGQANRIVTWTEACNNDIAAGCSNLGLSYHYGNYGVPVDLDLAVLFYEKGCDGGNSYGCSQVGVLIAQYKIGYQYAERASVYLKQGCDGGQAYGCYILAQFYEKGFEGISQNTKQSREYFRKACGLGYSNACL